MSGTVYEVQKLVIFLLHCLFLSPPNREENWTDLLVVKHNFVCSLFPQKGPKMFGDKNQGLADRGFTISSSSFHLYRITEEKDRHQDPGAQGGGGSGSAFIGVKSDKKKRELDKRRFE